MVAAQRRPGQAARAAAELLGSTVTAPAINTHGLRIETGKHAGELYTRLPVSYLRWMVNVRHQCDDVAQAELDRRGTQNPDLDVSGHAVDRLSLDALWLWRADAAKGEGINAWLHRIAKAALHVEPCAPGKHVWGPLVLVFEEGTSWPVLKTVIYKPRAAGIRKSTHHP